MLASTQILREPHGKFYIMYRRLSSLNFSRQGSYIETRANFNTCLEILLKYSLVFSVKSWREFDKVAGY